MKLPDGIEWPTYEDGEPLAIGDEVTSKAGYAKKIKSVQIWDDRFTLHFDDEASSNTFMHGEHPKRAEKDSWEKLEEDIKHGTCSYANKNGTECKDCRFSKDETRSCEAIVMEDIVRRAKKLAGIE